jgi:hypothetical protein
MKNMGLDSRLRGNDMQEIIDMKELKSEILTAVYVREDGYRGDGFRRMV